MTKGKDRFPLTKGKFFVCVAFDEGQGFFPLTKGKGGNVHVVARSGILGRGTGRKCSVFCHFPRSIFCAWNKIPHVRHFCFVHCQNSSPISCACVSSSPLLRNCRPTPGYLSQIFVCVCVCVCVCSGNKLKSACAHVTVQYIPT